jgi:hypothetical protein
MSRAALIGRLDAGRKQMNTVTASNIFGAAWFIGVVGVACALVYFEPVISHIRGH